jgi:tripeptidyl-peptidase I
MPSSQSARSVKRWLADEGIDVVRDNGMFITITTTVGVANRMLNATYAYYRVDGTRKLRVTEYWLPDEIREHVDVIHPTTYFGKENIKGLQRETRSEHDLVVRQASNQENCTIMTPDSIKTLYNIHYTPDPHSGSTVAIGSFLNHSSTLANLHLYQSAFNIPGPRNLSVVSINNGVDTLDPSSTSREADMDVQLINAISAPLPLTEFVTGGSPPFIPDAVVASNNNEPYLEFYSRLLLSRREDLPFVVSSSYDENERTVPPEYARRVCNLIGLLGLRGVTVLHCSGDWGLGAACKANDGSGRLEFDPQFPASCPYVTAVGGTQGVDGSASQCTAEQEAWFASSGGFSRYFQRPWYQDRAVTTYLDQHVLPETRKYYSAYTDFHGRGFPDVSAHALFPS